MKVNIFGIGAPKCGTTSLYQALLDSGSCCTSRPKETHFFCNDKLFANGIYWYKKNYFPHYSGENSIADITPSYCWDQPNITSKRIHEYNSDAKIILLMRDPLRRLESEWKMCYSGFYLYGKKAIHNTTALAGFEDWILAKGGTHAAIKSSLYGSAINAYANYFPKNSIMVASAEALGSDYINTMRSILTFLEIPADLAKVSPVKANARRHAYGLLSSVASWPVLRILPSRYANGLRHRLRNVWLQRDLHYPKPILSKSVTNSIYQIVLADCRQSVIDLSPHTSLWSQV